MKNAKPEHMKKFKEALVKAGYKKSHADKMLAAAKRHAKDAGYKLQTEKDKKDERKGEKKVDKKYHQTAKDRKNEKKGYDKMLKKSK